MIQPLLKRILPSSSAVWAASVVASSLDEPAADPTLNDSFFGDFIGFTSHGNGVAGLSRAYTSYTYNFRAGTYGSALNSTSAYQQDNYMNEVTYPPAYNAGCLGRLDGGT